MPPSGMADMGEEEEEEELLLSHGFGSSSIVLETPRLLTPRLPLETEAEPPVPISALRALQARGRSSLVCWQPADIHRGAHECTEAAAADRVPLLPARRRHLPPPACRRPRTFCPPGGSAAGSLLWG